jgi:hypothetical protein
MSNQWFSGKPPSVGWWPVRSPSSYSDTISWFDGAVWSWFCDARDDLESADRYARLRYGPGESKIEWSHRPKSWPKRSHT